VDGVVHPLEHITSAEVQQATYQAKPQSVFLNESLQQSRTCRKEGQNDNDTEGLLVLHRASQAIQQCQRDLVVWQGGLRASGRDEVLVLNEDVVPREKGSVRLQDTNERWLRTCSWR
jgi:hypothetical protein